jgi:hypothetical protein
MTFTRKALNAQSVEFGYARTEWAEEWSAMTYFFGDDEEPDLKWVPLREYTFSLRGLDLALQSLSCWQRAQARG